MNVNTELVYLLTINNSTKHTILINQPHTDKDVIRNQYKNLTRLYGNDPRFVARAHSLFETEKYGLYLTNYVENAVCIGNMEPETLGVWNPIPKYHFEEFDKETTGKVNVSRIAHLINSFDNKNLMGITKTQISGNDFMLTQETDFSDLQSIIHNTRLIGARSHVRAPFAYYINRIIEEFQVGTTRTNKRVLNGEFIINHQSVMPMTEEIIAEGIMQGMLLRKQNLTNQHLPYHGQ